MSDIPVEHIVLREDEFQTFQNPQTLFQNYVRSNRSLGYGLQIVFHSTILPKTTNPNGCLRTQDYLVEMLLQSERIVRLVHEFRTQAHGQSYADACFQVEDRAEPVTDESETIFNVLPTFGCLLLAPSLLWEKEPGQSPAFAADGAANGVNLQHRLKHAAVGNLRDLFFGLPMQMTGIKWNSCNRQATVAFVVTLVFREYDPVLFQELRDYLMTDYSMAPNETQTLDMGKEKMPKSSERTGTDGKAGGHVYLVWYKGRSYLTDYAPLILIYVVLLLYVYFSVCKLEMVTSKWGLAFSACFTVVASLCMSLGLCITIGLMVPTLNSSEIFPYLVVLIGFENVIILTKSVVATPIDLPVKYRIAEGLSKESWPLTKHYFTQLLLLGLGFLTFHPTMQEFCLFAVVGVSTDFFLQLFFFVTVLSIDIRRMELTDLPVPYNELSALHNSQRLLSEGPVNQMEMNESTITHADNHAAPTITTTNVDHTDPPSLSSSPMNSHSTRPCNCVPVVAFLKEVNSRARAYWSNLFPSRTLFHRRHKRRVSAAEATAFFASDEKAKENLPRRLRFLRFWAKYRLIQSLFIVVFALWILFIILYTTHQDQSIHSSDTTPSTGPSEISSNDGNEAGSDAKIPSSSSTIRSLDQQHEEKADLDPLNPVFNIQSPGIHRMFRQLESSGILTEPRRTHSILQPVEVTWDMHFLWNYLAFFQWPLLAKHYNLSLAGCHLVILEPLHLKLDFYVEPEMAQEDLDPSSKESPYGVPESESESYKKKLDWNWVAQSPFAEFWSVPLDNSTVVSSAATSAGQSASQAHSKPDSRLVGFGEDFLRLFGSSQPRSPSSSTSPGGLAGWTARLWLTASMLGTSFLGCSLVLVVTCLGMICFQELQSRSPVPSNREPVIRVLPLTIQLDPTHPGIMPDSADNHDSDTDSSPSDWILACGSLQRSEAHTSGPTVEGIIAASGIGAMEEADFPPYTASIRLWSTNSGLVLPPIQRYNSPVVKARQLASNQLELTFRPRSTVWSMTFLSSGSLIVGCSDGSIEIWDCETSRPRHLLYVVSQSVWRSKQSTLPSTPSPITDTTHPGGITILHLTGENNFCAGTSHGLVAFFNLPTPLHPVSDVIETQLANRQWREHRRAVAHLTSNTLCSMGIGSRKDLTLLASGAEDGRVVLYNPSSETPLHTVSLDPTAVLSMDLSHLMLAVSFASGTLSIVGLGLRYEESPEGTTTDQYTIDTSPTVMQLATGDRKTTNDQATRQSSRGYTPRWHLGAVGLRWSCRRSAIHSSSSGLHLPKFESFRLVTCELDETIAVWSVEPAKLIRTFRLNLSAISPSNPLVSVDERIVFGDQGYLRVINPWTAKYERSVQLLPPSTVLFRAGVALAPAHLSSILRRWSRELVPIGTAGLTHTIEGHGEQSYESAPMDSRNSVMVSVANHGNTLVIIPLSTLRTA